MATVGRELAGILSIIGEKTRPSPAGDGQWADDNDVGNWSSSTVLLVLEY
jgi:hypothetical protein